jgi:hypothetical protein
MVKEKGLLESFSVLIWSAAQFMKRALPETKQVSFLDWMEYFTLQLSKSVLRPNDVHDMLDISWNIELVGRQNIDLVCSLCLRSNGGQFQVLSEMI